MRVNCNIRSCRHWSEKEEHKNYICDEGGCSLDEITISDEEMTAAGFIPQCAVYEERDDGR